MKPLHFYVEKIDMETIEVFVKYVKKNVLPIVRAEKMISDVVDVIVEHLHIKYLVLKTLI